MSKFMGILKPAFHEIPKIKQSRFIAAAFPIANVSQVKKILLERREEIPVASHHCYAYVLTHPKKTRLESCSDDGEPHGTSGQPILRRIQSMDVENICVVVSRVFGGTKLGKGGLSRAYGQACHEVLEIAEISELDRMASISVNILPSFIGPFHRTCDQFGKHILIQDQEMGISDMTIRLNVPLEMYSNFCSELQIKCQGTAQIVEL